MDATPNEGKPLVRAVDGVSFERIPIRTHVVVADDDIVEIVKRYASDHLVPSDILFVTEKIVAITQGRSYPVDSIEARPLARTLSRYVTKTSHGIGLGIPETMEMALRECGTPRILFASAVAAVTKVFGRKGDFYRIAGPKARGIDGPTSHTLPPYNTQVVLTPLRPREVAHELRTTLGGKVDVAIVDINDFGGNVLGSTLDAAGESQLVSILGDNPLGQRHQSTPLGIIRRV
ncbi:MAG: coenzyme F420-0:L-glutamate ligase [Microcella sp.]|nr:coenzyme F420-0:L-glutamate ligase [Microcella sp.]